MVVLFSVRGRHSLSGTGPSEGVHFSLRRNPSLLDDPVRVHSGGLQANSPVTLAIKLFNEKEKLVGGSHFVNFHFLEELFFSLQQYLRPLGYCATYLC